MNTSAPRSPERKFMIETETAMTVLSAKKEVQAKNIVINDYVRYWSEPASDGGLPFMLYEIRWPVTDHPDIYDRVVYWIERHAKELGFRAIPKNYFLSKTVTESKPRLGNALSIVHSILKKVGGRNL